MNKLKFLFLTLLASASVAFGQTQYALTSLTAGTTANIADVAVTVTQLTLTASTATNTTFTFYDSSDTTTNYARYAYSAPLSYRTNFTLTHTDINGVTITNSFSGIFSTFTSVSSNVVERPRILRTVVLGSDQKTLDVNLSTVNGLNVQANNTATVETTYKVRR